MMEGSAYAQHLTRKPQAAQQNHAAGAKNIMKMAAKARSRVLYEVQGGQVVYYVRRGKNTRVIGYRGPAKVIAVEKRGRRCSHRGLALPRWHLDPIGSRTFEDGNIPGHTHTHTPMAC